MEFKDQLRIAREAKGWSQAEMAVAMGVSGQAVIWWELGVHEPRTPMLRKLEELLNARFNLTGTKPLEGDESTVFGLGKDVVLLAQKIAMLPQRHRNALETLVEIGSVKKGKKTSFINVESKGTPIPGFMKSVDTEEGKPNARAATSGRPSKTKNRATTGQGEK